MRSVFQRTSQLHRCSTKRFASSSSDSLVFSGRVAMVTGSTSGIGLGVAQHLARKGASVILTGYQPVDGTDKMKDAIKQVESCFVSDGTQFVELLDLDLSSSSVNCVDLQSEINGVFSTIPSQKKSANENCVGILVNNAGFQHVSPIVDFPGERYRGLMNILLHSPFFIMQSVVPGMIEQGRGRVVNIASTHGLVASAFKGPYVSAKHGLIGLTKSMALELAEHSRERSALGLSFDVTANCICPGYVETPLAKGQVEKRMKESGRDYDTEARMLVGEKMPMAQFVRIEDISAMVEHLCGPHCTIVNGASYTMDGAWTAC